MGRRAGLLPLDLLAELTNMGTLFAFVVVCAAVPVMRRIDPHAPRPFRMPGVPYTAFAGMGMCLLLMLSLGWPNWARLFIWMFIGLAIYFSYGRHHSKARRAARGGAGLVADDALLSEAALSKTSLLHSEDI